MYEINPSTLLKKNNTSEITMLIHVVASILYLTCFVILTFIANYFSKDFRFQKLFNQKQQFLEQVISFIQIMFQIMKNFFGNFILISFSLYLKHGKNEFKQLYIHENSQNLDSTIVICIIINFVLWLLLVLFDQIFNIQTYTEKVKISK